jgi:hypothetical protein
MVKCTHLAILLCIASSSFAAISIRLSIGDKLEYSYGESSISIVSSSTSYREIINIDSISYISSDTFYYYNKLVIESHRYGPRPNTDPIEYYDTILNDTISDKLGYYFQNASEISMTEDSSVILRISKLSPNIDTFFFNGSIQVNSVLLNKDTIINMNGNSLQALQGSKEEGLDGYPGGVQTTTVLFSDIYGLCEFSCCRPIPHGTFCISRHLDKTNGQSNTINISTPATFRRIAQSNRANHYLLNGQLLLNSNVLDNTLHRYRRSILSN